MRRTLTFFLVMTVSLFASGQLRKFVPTWKDRYGRPELSPSIGLGSHAFQVADDFSYNYYMELGVTSLYGEHHQWTSWGLLPMGFDWKYIGPHVKGRFSLFNNLPDSLNPVTNSLLLGNALEVGVNGGIGALVLIFPLSVNGSVGYVTNFKNNGIKYSLGTNVKWLSINVGQQITFGVKEGSVISQGTIDLTFMLWDK